MSPRPRLAVIALLTPTIVALVGGVIILATQPRADLHRVYRVGVDNLRPYQFFGPGQLPDGFAVQTLTEAARRSGIHLQWVNAPEGPDVSLRSGLVDLWPRLRDTPERKSFTHITEPWIRQSFCLLSQSPGDGGEKAASNAQRIASQPSVFIQHWVRRYVPGAIPIFAKSIRWRLRRRSAAGKRMRPSSKRAWPSRWC